MIESGQFKTYKLILKTVSPVFIGSGREYSKTDYVFSQKDNTISFINLQKLFEFLVKNNFEDQYEKFILSGNTDMQIFLHDNCGMSNDEMQLLYLYTVDTSYVLDSKHSLKNIQAFQRNTKNQAYIPGSSLKGVLRTVILFSMMKAEGITHPYQQLNPNDKRANFNYIDESHYLSQLNFEKAQKKDKLLSDIMRGVSVSDSTTIDNSCFTLATKIDMDTEGLDHTIGTLVRECIKPNTEITFALTLDNSVLHNRITKEYIEESIVSFYNYYYDSYILKFSKNSDEALELNNIDQAVFLGGGVGFFSKTLTYPYYGEDNALKMVSDFFVNGRQTSQHGHDRDLQLGISPHMLKYTDYLGRLYPFGVCEVSIK